MSDKPNGVTFKVFGEAQTQGSKVAFNHPHTGKAMMMESKSKAHKTWRNLVAEASREAWGGQPVTPALCAVSITFQFVRPKSHYGTGRNAEKLKDGSPHDTECGKRKDIDKLVRAVLDGITGTILQDDYQVLYLTASRKWIDRTKEPFAEIQLSFGDAL